MNALTRFERWDPFREMEDLHQRLATVFGTLPARRGGDQEEAMTVAQWAPLVDIVEEEKEYAIKLDLPEIKREEVKVTVENDVLSISGERRQEKEEKGRKYHRVERAYGMFVRSFTIPDDADPAKISAEMKEGVLRVRLPKSEKARPKAVEVKVG